jgi:hypothetical protein
VPGRIPKCSSLLLQRRHRMPTSYAAAAIRATQGSPEDDGNAGNTKGSTAGLLNLATSAGRVPNGPVLHAAPKRGVSPLPVFMCLLVGRSRNRARLTERPHPWPLDYF